MTRRAPRRRSPFVDPGPVCLVCGLRMVHIDRDPAATHPACDPEPTLYGRSWFARGR